MGNNIADEDILVEMFNNRYVNNGPDGIPTEVFKIASKIVDFHLTYVINQDIVLNSFSEFTKVASVRPLY